MISTKQATDVATEVLGNYLDNRLTRSLHVGVINAPSPHGPAPTVAVTYSLHSEVNIEVHALIHYQLIEALRRAGAEDVSVLRV